MEGSHEVCPLDLILRVVLRPPRKGASFMRWGVELFGATGG